MPGPKGQILQFCTQIQGKWTNKKQDKIQGNCIHNKQDKDRREFHTCTLAVFLIGHNNKHVCGYISKWIIRDILYNTVLDNRSELQVWQANQLGVQWGTNYIRLCTLPHFFLRPLPAEADGLRPLEPIPESSTDPTLWMWWNNTIHVLRYLLSSSGGSNIG